MDGLLLEALMVCVTFVKCYIYGELSVSLPVWSP